MTIAAGLDIGNATTEVVIGRLTAAGLEVVAADRAPTRRAKGTPESLAGAAGLVRRLERRTGLHVTRAVATLLRPVETTTGSLPEERTPTGRLCAVAMDAPTAGGSGFGTGRPVRYGDPLTGDDPVVVVVPSGPHHEVVAETLAPLARAGRLAGVLIEGDEAVLVANRLPIAVPVMDGVSPQAVLSAVLVAVEVPADGRPLQILTDPLKVVTALGLDADEVADAAALAAHLFDARNAVVTLGATLAALPPALGAWIEVGGERMPFLAGHEALHAGGVGAAGAYALPPGLVARDVDDLWTVDLGAVASAVVARRSAASERPVTAAAMHTSVGWSDPATHLSMLLGIAVETAPSEAVAARAGALTTPGAPADAVVVDLGAGTIDVVTQDGVVVAAGAGDLLTASIAALTGSSKAAAEWVKRGPAHRVEAPQILLAEDGVRVFLEQAAPAETIGSLVVRGPAGLLAFSRTLAPGEWRALRLRLKTELIGGNIARALRTLDTVPSTVIVVGGTAGDDEVLAAVTRGLPAGTIVGRGDVAGTLGHRYAVAHGLLQGCRPLGLKRQPQAGSGGSDTENRSMKSSTSA